jgi:glucokinase
VSELAIGIDIGGSHVEYGFVRGSELLASETIPVREPLLKAVLPEVESGVRRLAGRLGLELHLMAGVALGICAIVDGANSLLATNGKYDDGVGFNFAQWSKSSFGLRCRAENDAGLALLGEHFAGAAWGFDDAVLITLGTGIGGAVMLNGKLLRSVGRKAGGLAGHLGVSWQGRICSCGNRGCAEAEASTASLDAICRDHESFAGSALSAAARTIDFRMLFEAADGGNTLAREVLDHCIGVWTSLTVSLIHAYDPQVLVFGGGVMHRQEAILPKIREHVGRHAWAEKDSVKIVPAMLGSSAALLGAFPLLRDNA